MRGEATDSGKVHNGDTNMGEAWGKTSARARCKQRARPVKDDGPLVLSKVKPAGQR